MSILIKNKITDIIIPESIIFSELRTLIQHYALIVKLQ